MTILINLNNFLNYWFRSLELFILPNSIIVKCRNKLSRIILGIIVVKYYKYLINLSLVLYDENIHNNGNELHIAPTVANNN